MAVLLVLFGLVSVGNGLWMLFAPAAWYHELPAGVPDTGPLNAHFVRDVGAAFLTVGVAMVVAAGRRAARLGVLLAATLFYGLHAAVHVADLVAGRLPAEHWLIDLPGVFLPPLILAVMAARLRRVVPA
jgi:hypothetical protein